jgi:hypothetical protein
MFNEKFHEIISNEGAVSIVTWSKDLNNVNVSNTWNSYLKIPKDGRILIPAAGMRKTEKNINDNNQVKITLGSKEVQGLWGPGAGFLLEGTAEFIYEGEEFEMIKETFHFMKEVRVLAVTVTSMKQTV